MAEQTIAIIKNNFKKNYRVYVYRTGLPRSVPKNRTYDEIVNGVKSTESSFEFLAVDNPSKNHFLLTVDNPYNASYLFYIVDTDTKSVVTRKQGDVYPCFNNQIAFTDSGKNYRGVAQDDTSYNCFGFYVTNSTNASLSGLNMSANYYNPNPYINHIRYFKILAVSNAEEKANLATLNIKDTYVGYSDNLEEFEAKIENTDYFNELTAESESGESGSESGESGSESGESGSESGESGSESGESGSESGESGSESGESGSESGESGSESGESGSESGESGSESGDFTITIQNCANGVLYAKENGVTPDDPTIASNAENKSSISIPYSTIFNIKGNLYFVFYPNPDYVQSERPYAVITYKDSDGKQNQFNLPFQNIIVDISNTQRDVDTFEVDIAINGTRKTFQFGGYGVYYDTTLTPETYVSGAFNMLAGSDVPTPTPAISEYGLFNVYKTSATELNQLSQNRFKIYSSDYYYTEIDLSGYITSLIEYPFDISATSEFPLILGNVATQINSHTVDTYIITNSFEISVNGLYRDSRDISDSEIICNLPFISPFNIDSIYINSTIKVEYKTDILTNASICNIYSDDKLIHSETCVIGYKLPYVLYQDPINELVDNLRFKTEVCNITVRQKLNNSSRYNTLKKDLIQNFKGYVKTNEHISLDTSRMLGNEVEQVKNLLQNGIYIE